MHACVHACPAHLVLLLYLSAGGQTSGRKTRCACSSLRQPWGSGTSRQPCRTCAPWRTAGRTRPSCGTALAGQAAVLLASAVLLAACVTPGLPLATPGQGVSCTSQAPRSAHTCFLSHSHSKHRSHTLAPTFTHGRPPLLQAVQVPGRDRGCASCPQVLSPAAAAPPQLPAAHAAAGPLSPAQHAVC